MLIMYIAGQYCTLVCNTVLYHKEIYKVHRCTVMYIILYTSLFNNAQTNIFTSIYYPNIAQILTTYSKNIVDHLCFLQHKSLTLTPKIAYRGRVHIMRERRTLRGVGHTIASLNQ